MNKNAIIKELSKRTKINKQTAKKVLDALEEVWLDGLKQDKRVPLGRKIGSLVVKTTKARKGRNPKTGELITIPAKKVVRFRMSKTLKKTFS